MLLSRPWTVSSLPLQSWSTSSASFAPVVVAALERSCSACSSRGEAQQLLGSLPDHAGRPSSVEKVRVWGAGNECSGGDGRRPRHMGHTSGDIPDTHRHAELARIAALLVYAQTHSTGEETFSSRRAGNPRTFGAYSYACEDRLRRARTRNHDTSKHDNRARRSADPPRARPV